MIKKKQFNGVPFPGILHQKAQKVNVPERGISFNRPERYVVNTPTGQLEIGQGDWVVSASSGNLYVIKNNDIESITGKQPRKWWQLWYINREIERLSK